MPLTVRLRPLTVAVAAALLTAGVPALLQAQVRWAQAPSTRATATVTVAGRAPQGAQRPAPKKIVIDYGQPHVRGRQVVGGLIPDGQVWRLGANEATSLTTEVNLTIGGKAVPAGTYTLFALAQGNGMQLIVSRKTGQWGTEYDPAMDLVRVPMTVRTLGTGVEALQIALTPSGDAPLEGTLRITWGTVEAMVPYVVQP